MDELIEENMGLVVSIVETFKPRNQTEREDLIDAGRIGLWKALKKVDKNKGKISTYAWKPIRWAIIKEINKSKNHKSLDNIKEEPIIKPTSQFWELYSKDITQEEINLIELRRQGYKYREISSITGKSSASVRQKIYNAISKIKENNE